MKKQNILFLLILLFIVTLSEAQQVNSLYFLDNVPFQQNINPALQPEREGFYALPVIGFGQISAGNTSFSVKSFLYQPKGQKQLVSFLHPEFGNVDNFYKKIKKTTLINADYQINLISFGFRFKQKNYFTFNISERIEMGLGIPKDLFKLLLYGAPEETGNKFNIKTLNLAATAYTEIGAGVAFANNAKVQTGFKIKFLLGNMNATASNKELNLTTGIDKWEVQGNSTLRMAAPIQISNDFNNVIMPSKVIDYIKPSGYGGAIDLGIVYNIKKNLRLTAAITDLGFIYWTNPSMNMQSNIDYSFNGIEVDGVSLLDGFNASGVLDSLKNGFMGSFSQESESENSSGYVTMTTAKLNVGFDWTFCKDKLGLGILSRTMLLNKNVYEELTASFKIKPVNWFNMNISYSILNGKSSLGAGMGLRAGPILFFFAADYIPLSYTSYNKIPIPYHASSFNLAGGITVVWGKADKDKDGIANKFDLCPNTPRGVQVDSVGCPLDTDCDGVPDYLDLCPNTPIEAKGLVDGSGCPLDADHDGVPDYLDQCPNTLNGVAVDSIGCPLDTDKDGVPDFIDQCPDTPIEALGKVDSVGCPLDTDHDGVPDYLDKCENTPLNAPVDSVGCPLDTDKDGVPDYLDQCPDTPAEAIGKVDSVGCPLDTDHDGVPDYLDKCPTVPGTLATNGCPEIKQEITKLFTKALQGIQFATGKDILLKTSFPILNDIAKVMIENPEYKLTIAGHTDNQGDPVKNLDLSDRRALSVKSYLMKKGVDAIRMTSVGYGDTKPVADNSTAAGRKENRRVEFTVEFEVKTLESVPQ